MPLISRLLVANRGEIARRIMRTARSLAIPTVAVYSDPDAGAPFVTEADEAVRKWKTASDEKPHCDCRRNVGFRSESLADA